MTIKPGNLGPVQKERRRFGRRNVLKKGTLTISKENSSTVMECLVVDISAGGARIRPAGELDGLTEPVLLHILDDDLAFKCELIYWRDGHAGLEFKAGPWRPSWEKRDRTEFERQLLQRAIDKA